MKTALALSILIILFIIVYIILAIRLHKKVEKDCETERKNKELKREYQRLQDSVEQQRREFTELESKTECLKDQKAQLYTELNELDEIVNKTKESNEQLAGDAYSNYVNLLEQSYKETEASFDFNMRSLRQDITNLNQELDKLKATRAAAHEALLKEQEVKENKDNYRLIVPEIEKRDIKLLNSIKKELINERPVNMIIWQTYYSKRANELCSRILGTKNVTGIYKITEISTGRCYIGQSKNVKDRFREHMKCGLGIDTPNGNKLYQAMLDSSIEDFTFELIEECYANDLDEKERYFISLYQSYDYGFNSNRGNSNGRA